MASAQLRNQKAIFLAKWEALRLKTRDVFLFVGYHHYLMLLIVLAIILLALLLAGCCSSTPQIPNIFLFSMYYQAYTPSSSSIKSDPDISVALNNMISDAALEVRVGYFGICIQLPGSGKGWNSFVCSSNATLLGGIVSADQDPLNLIWIASEFQKSVVFPWLIMAAVLLAVVSFALLVSFPTWHHHHFHPHQHLQQMQPPQQQQQQQQQQHEQEQEQEQQPYAPTRATSRRSPSIVSPPSDRPPLFVPYVRPTPMFQDHLELRRVPSRPVSQVCLVLIFISSVFILITMLWQHTASIAASNIAQDFGNGSVKSGVGGEAMLLGWFALGLLIVSMVGVMVMVMSMGITDRLGNNYNIMMLPGTGA